MEEDARVRFIKKYIRPNMSLMVDDEFNLTLLKLYKPLFLLRNLKEDRTDGNRIMPRISRKRYMPWPLN